MKYFPPERAQEQLDISGDFSISTHGALLECLRSVARAMRHKAMNSGGEQRGRLLAFEDVLIRMHDDMGEGL